MHLHVLYRTFPGMNKKQRPDWFNRRMALVSLIESLEQSGEHFTLTLVADGGLPEELKDFDLPVEIVSGGNTARSMRAAFALLGRKMVDADPDTFYWICEDDYLYRPEAMTQLAVAARSVSHSSYLTLHVPDDSAWMAAHRSQPERFVPAAPAGAIIDGWKRVPKTTSTFGAWRATWLEDVKTISLTTYNGAPYDTPLFYILQGIKTFELRYLFADLYPAMSKRGIGKVIINPITRVLSNIASRRRRSLRMLFGPVEDLAAHAEPEFLSKTFDWAALARDVNSRS